MSLLSSTEDVEEVAKAWIQKRYGKKLGKLKFIEVMSDEGVWTVKASVKLATGVLSITPHIVQLRIDAQSTDVLGYSESEVAKK